MAQQPQQQQGQQAPQQPQQQQQPQHQQQSHQQQAHQQATQAVSGLLQAHGLAGIDAGAVLSLVLQLVQLLKGQQPGAQATP